MYTSATGRDEKMNYEEFKAEYTKVFAAMMSYTCNQAGSEYFSEKMADLAEAHPEWADKVEAEA
jgi:hypothetical protein